MKNNITKRKVGRPPLEKKILFQKLQPFLKAGYSIPKACILAKVSKSTVYNYCKQDEDFWNEIERERNLVSIKARYNIIEAINKGDVGLSLEWLDRVEKDEFSKKIEISTGNKKDPIELLEDIFKDEK